MYVRSSTTLRISNTCIPRCEKTCIESIFFDVIPLTTSLHFGGKINFRSFNYVRYILNPIHFTPPLILSSSNSNIKADTQTK